MANEPGSGTLLTSWQGPEHVNLIWSLVSKLKPNGSNTTSPSLAGSMVRVEPSLNVRAKVPMHPPWTAPSVHKEPLLVSPVRFASRFGSEKKDPTGSAGSGIRDSDYVAGRLAACVEDRIITSRIRTGYR